MRSNIGFIQHRIGLALDEGGGNVVDVVLSWREWPADAEPDPVNGGFKGTPIPKTAATTCFFHSVAIGRGQVKQFNEFEEGDAILDFAPDIALAGKAELTFTIDGEVWVPKPISDQLAQSWDVKVKGGRLLRSVLVRKQT